MNTAISSELLMLLAKAAPEDIAEVERFLRVRATPTILACGDARPTARFVFRQSGSVCAVVFAGGPEFHIPNTDGAKYLDHLLHRPNETIRAFDLELAVKPYKGEVREANSVQAAADARMQREARAELLELEAELAEAEAEGLAEKVARLNREIAQIKKFAGATALLSGDTGERARDNVRKAIGKVIARLRKGGAAEQALALHLTQSISLGYDVVYTQPAGKIWQ